MNKSPITKKSTTQSPTKSPAKAPAKAPRKPRPNAHQRGKAPRSNPAGFATAGLTLRRIPISRIDPAAYNPRLDLQPGDPEYEKIARSIDEFGCIEPLVWNSRTGRLVGGHQRLYAVFRELWV